MPTNDTPDRESIELDERDVRALTQYLTVLPEAPGMYEVVSQSGKSYTVDARRGRCTCPDHEYNLPTEDGREKCKHRARVAYATGECPIPAWVDRDGVDELLGEHTEATPRVVATDGGVIDAGDEGEILDESGEDGVEARPEDCGCGAWNVESDRVTLPCWPCYRDGFDVPNRNIGKE